MDKYDRKKYLLIGIIITISGMVIILIDTSNIMFYLLGRGMFVGIGLGALGPVAYSYAGDVINYDNRSAVSGGIAVIGIVSSGLGIVLSVVIARQGVFHPYLTILFLLVIFLIVIAFITEPLRGREEPEVKIAMKDNKMVFQIESPWQKYYTLWFVRKSDKPDIFQAIEALDAKKLIFGDVSRFD